MSSSSLAHDLLLLLLNLAPLTRAERVLEVFLEALNHRLEGVQLALAGAPSEPGPTTLEITSGRTRFGQINVTGDAAVLAGETGALVRNAVAMLAIVLENLQQRERLAGEKHHLQEIVDRQTSDLLGAYRDLKQESRERQSQGEALRRNEELLRQLTENIGEVFWMTGADPAELLFVSPAYERVWGRPREEWLGQPGLWLETVLPEDRERVHAAAVERRAGGLYDEIYRIRRPDGTVRWIRDRAFPVRNQAGEVYRIAGLAEDITEARRARQALRDQAQRLSLHMENTPLGVIEWDLDLRVTAWNRAAELMFGFTREEALGRSAFDLIVGADAKADVEKAWRALVAGTGGGRSTNENLTKANETRLCDWYNTPLTDHLGVVVGIASLVQDVTQQVRAQEELVRTQALLYAAIEQMPAGVLIADAPDVRIRLANSFALGVRGRAAEPLTEIPAELHPTNWQTFHPDGTPYRPEDLPLSRAVLRGETTSNVDVIIRRPDDEERWVLGNAAPVRDAAGKVVAGVVVFPDITERRRAEEKRVQLEQRLQQAHKMESIGTLAGGIAHDFNNLLSAIVGYTELSLMSVPDGSDLADNLSHVRSASQRATELVRQILTFSRQTQQEAKPLRVGPIVSETLSLMRASLPKTIEIHTDLHSQAIVQSDPTQIHQILMNLCTNAGLAMREHGGVLAVELADVNLDARFAAAHPETTPGPYLRLTVSDTGHGMEPEVTARVFEPFFTTRSQGEGTGMGLSVVHGLVKGHGGTITAYSEAGKGTTFTVFLPAVERRAEDRGTLEEALPMGTERILFVDDEEFQVGLAERLLGHLGYRVTATTSSLRALDLFRSTPNAFDLVITDMTMPRMTGDELAGEMLGIRPDIPIVLCTGYSERITREQALGKGICAFVMKPVVIRELAETLRNVLDLRSSPPEI